MLVYRYCLIISLLLAIFCSSVYGLQGSTAANGSNAQAVHELGYTGQGINVGLISARNVQDTHEAFNDSNGVHVFNSDYSGSDVNYMGGGVPGHDTWVAGIIASRGWTGHPNNIGVSPDCNLYSARVVSDAGGISTGFVEDALEALINTYNCRVFVTAIALPSPAFGDANGSSPWSLMYDFFAYTNNVIFALASGNSSSNPSIFGDAYNGITTAALIDEPNDFYLRVGGYLSGYSNPGPTIDGRKKPEISCPGSSQTTPSIGSDTSYYTTAKDGATSFSVPQTGGVAALLLEYADSTTEPNDGRNEVIKAVIVNSTFPNIDNKAGNPTYPADPNNTWHPQRGYGRIDAYRAYLTLSAGKVAAGTPINSTSGWAYNTLSDSQTHTYFINAQRRERLVLTVTWNRVVTRDRKRPSNPWVYSDEEPNKFNIDITIKDPCDTVVYSEIDILNNLTKIDIPLELTGEYEITLTNTTSKTRDYAMAFELLPPLTGDFNIDYIVDESDLRQMALDWLTAGPDTDIVPDVPDGMVNWLDFAEFADNWLKIEPKYYNP